MRVSDVFLPRRAGVQAVKAAPRLPVFPARIGPGLVLVAGGSRGVIYTYPEVSKNAMKIFRGLVAFSVARRPGFGSSGYRTSYGYGACSPRCKQNSSLVIFRIMLRKPNGLSAVPLSVPLWGEDSGFCGGAGVGRNSPQFPILSAKRPFLGVWMWGAK